MESSTPSHASTVSQGAPLGVSTMNVFEKGTRQKRNLGTAITVLLLTVAGCTQSVTPAPTPNPKLEMAYAWTGDLSQRPSDQQFAKDKYACAQDYRMTQPAVPIQRDVATEINLMTLHLEVCLASKGWELRPIIEQAKRSSSPSEGPWNKYKSDTEITTASMGTPNEAAREYLKKRMPHFDWDGDPAKEPSFEEFLTYFKECDQKFMTLYPKFQVINLSDYDRIIEYQVACMRTHGYRATASSR